MSQPDQEVNNLQENYRQQSLFLALFTRISEYMSSSPDTDKATNFFVNSLAEMFNVNRVSFMLFDANKEELSIQASQGLDPALAGEKVKLAGTFSGLVVKERKALLVKDVDVEYPDSSRNRMANYLSKSFVVVPVESRNRIIGVISLTERQKLDTFNEHEVELLKLACRYFALYLENNKLLGKNNDLSNFDVVTNLYNHRYFQEQLIEEIYRSERYRRTLCLVMLDIDKFSDYNQTHGYSAGDNVLKQIGRLLKDNTRQVDVLCRYESDQFAIILPETRAKEAVIVGEKIREKISSAIFTETENRKSSLEMTRLMISQGIAEHRVGLTTEELINHAQSALKNAKEKGRNCVVVFK
jgi:diguanylate cyclase (GGDEF)-like protein